MDFKQAVDKMENEGEGSQVTRSIKRKKDNPTMNARDFAAENRSFGVKNEVDLVLQRIAGQKGYDQNDYKKAQGMFERKLINYSEDLKVMKSKKAQTFLTV